LCFIIERNAAAAQRFQRERAVHSTAIEIEITERASDETRYCCLFTGTGGTVDRDG